VERPLFASRLAEAAALARDFARTLLEEPLSDSLIFRVHFNQSYDGNPLVGDETVFPDEARRTLNDVSADQVVGALWREGRVPEWIDVSVVGETPAATRLQLLCCGRFTRSMLYHEKEGRPPFHVTGPVFPVNHVEGRKFSLYDRSECWTPAELARLGSHAAKVWSLKLVSPEFTDGTLERLPALSRLELLELSVPLLGGGLTALARLPRLRVLRLHLLDSAPFEAPALHLPALDTLDVFNPPLRPWGSALLVRGAPALRWLTLQAPAELLFEADCPPALTNFSVTAAGLKTNFQLGPSVKSAYLHLKHATAQQLRVLLANAVSLDALDLSGTDVDDAFAEEVVERFRLKYLNLVNTSVTRDALGRIARAHPKLKLLPRLSTGSARA
jgi:hypothetical protein